MLCPFLSPASLAWAADAQLLVLLPAQVLPYSVTEHAPHTTALWNTIATTGDVYYEASRLASQILFNVRCALQHNPVPRLFAG